MDRSYPYSRRLVSRARLHKRVAAVAAAGLIGAAALFVVAWKPGALPAAPATAEAPAPLLAGGIEGQERGVRRIYPYSIVPGGVADRTELKRVIRTDRVVATHYASFDADKARPVVVDKPRAVHVSYRKGDKVYWTARKVMLAEGETLLSDGRNEMRARCANRISDVPQYPVEAHQPAMEELDNPVEVADGDALGADALPVSMDFDEGIGSHGGQTIVLGGGSSSSTASAAADKTVSSNTYAPAMASPITTTGWSNSSGSTGSSPGPATPPSTGSGTGDAGAGTAPGGGTSNEAPAGDGAAGTPPATAPAPAPMPVPEPLPGATPSPIPTPTPRPLPGVDQTVGGGSSELPAGPGADPLLPRPGAEAGPFIPKPELGPPPGTIGDKPDSPADVPEPGSLWLAGSALAALVAVRRKRAPAAGRA